VSGSAFAGIVVGLLPVIAFLAALLSFDSYKLVKLPLVVGTVGAGAIAAWASYELNGTFLSWVPMDWSTFSRFVAPLIEEVLKGAIVLALIRAGRVAFLVDAAIFGFAAGTGFSVLENTYYSLSGIAQHASLGTWIIRGFGTAIMHGGATAILAVASLGFLEGRAASRVFAVATGLALAYCLHSLYNQALLPPIYQAFLVLALVPALLAFVFRRGEKSLAQWLGTGFDNDAMLLELINSGEFSASPIGQYLTTLRTKFEGPVVADMLCYVRLHTELALRAKGMLMMRETGFDPPPDPMVQEKFAEMRYLEGTMGATGRIALRPMLHLSRKDLRQIYLL
jgi:RsiW-degrading membrane proteinase PrsW (M82 family)